MGPAKRIDKLPVADWNWSYCAVHVSLSPLYAVDVVHQMVIMDVNICKTMNTWVLKEKEDSATQPVCVNFCPVLPFSD